MKIAVMLSLCFLLACKNPDAVKKYAQEEAEARNKSHKLDTVQKDTPSSEKVLDTELLVGHWSLDIEQLKQDVIRNAKSKKQSDLFIKDFDKRYSSIEMEFYEDKRFALYLNSERFIGLWGVSSDKVSYYIQMSDDFIELHEVISLTEDKLIEIPVAQMKNAGLPLERIVYVKK